jgi:hypothetical protein
LPDWLSFDAGTRTVSLRLEPTRAQLAPASRVHASAASPDGPGVERSRLRWNSSSIRMRPRWPEAAINQALEGKLFRRPGLFALDLRAGAPISAARESDAPLPGRRRPTGSARCRSASPSPRVRHPAMSVITEAVVDDMLVPISPPRFLCPSDRACRCRLISTAPSR